MIGRGSSPSRPNSEAWIGYQRDPVGRWDVGGDIVDGGSGSGSFQHLNVQDNIVNGARLQ